MGVLITMDRHHVHGYTLSLGAHAIVLIIVALIVEQTPTDPSAGQNPTVPTRLVWSVAGPGSPGGSGKESPQPARAAEGLGNGRVPLPVAPRTWSSAPQIQEPPPPRIGLPDPRVSSGLSESIGVIGGQPGALESSGPGSGPNPGNGRGTGLGDGIGDRIGDDGHDGAQPGNGVSWPRLVREVKPNYTAEAMRAQIEGLVELEIIVLADGSVGRVSLLRSLDSRFGLDQEAIKAVRNWRFEPGRRMGKAIPVRVGVELSFNLR
jgi:protein TonB